MQVNTHTVALFVLLLGSVLSNSVYKDCFGCTLRHGVQHKAGNLATHWHTLLDLRGSWHCSHIPDHAACHTQVCQCRLHPSGVHTFCSIHIHPERQRRHQGRLTQSWDTGMSWCTVDSIPKEGTRMWFTMKPPSFSVSQFKLVHYQGLLWVYLSSKQFSPVQMFITELPSHLGSVLQINKGSSQFTKVFWHAEA